MTSNEFYQPPPRGAGAPDAPRTRFLHGVQRRLRGEAGIPHVLGPDFNAAHRDHFHLDMGPGFWWY